MCLVCIYSRYLQSPSYPFPLCLCHFTTKRQTTVSTLLQFLLYDFPFLSFISSFTTKAHLHMNIVHDEMVHPLLELCYLPDEFNDIDSHCRIQRLRPLF